jgi:hypothetical protein
VGRRLTASDEVEDASSGVLCLKRVLDHDGSELVLSRESLDLKAQDTRHRSAMGNGTDSIQVGLDKESTSASQGRKTRPPARRLTMRVRVLDMRPHLPRMRSVTSSSRSTGDRKIGKLRDVVDGRGKLSDVMGGKEVAGRVVEGGGEEGREEEREEKGDVKEEYEGTRNEERGRVGMKKQKVSILGR